MGTITAERDRDKLAMEALIAGKEYLLTYATAQIGNKSAAVNRAYLSAVELYLLRGETHDTKDYLVSLDADITGKIQTQGKLHYSVVASIKSI